MAFYDSMQSHVDNPGTHQELEQSAADPSPMTNNTGESGTTPDVSIAMPANSEPTPSKGLHTPPGSGGYGVMTTDEHVNL